MRIDKNGGDFMAVLAKPVNVLPIVKVEKVKEMNSNKISKELADTCRKAGKLFGKAK